MEVIAPTGMAEPLPMLLDIVSAIKRRILPKSAEAGIDTLWSFPSSFLDTCGQMIPTKLVYYAVISQCQRLWMGINQCDT